MKRTSVINALGMGLYSCWFDAALMGSQMELKYPAAKAPMEAFVVALVAAAAVIALAAVSPKQARRIVGSKTGVLTVSLVAAIGMALTIAGSLYAMHPFVYLGATLSGVGTAGLFLGWADVIISGGGKGTALDISAAFALGLVFDAALQLLVPEASMVVLCLLPLGSGLALLYRLRMETVLDDGERPLPYESRRLFGVDLRVVGALCLINLALGYVLRAGSYAEVSSQNPIVGFYISRGIAAALFCLIAYRSHGRSVRPLTKVGLLVMVAGTLCLLLFSSSQVFGMWASVLFSAGFVFFDIFTWVVLAEVSVNSGRCRLGIFAAGQVFVFLFESLGILLAMRSAGLPVDPDPNLGAALADVIAVCMVFVLTLGCILVFDNDSGLWTQLGFGADGGGNDQEGNAAFAEQIRQHGLTSREAEVAVLLAEGRSYKVIAEKLLVSQDTVKVHVKAIYQKFGVHSKQDFIEIASGKDADDVTRGRFF